MAGALYRKYRSKSFDDVIGQEHITTTLINSIKNGTFAHAYLLTGPRGVGKTSVARLFAYEINGLEYGGDKHYSDIIEIDAASNRRIDEIRELRDKVNIAPSILQYKTYIIDEVHMLTREAFNALLKTLEEPPAHVIFILATTDFHKVPDTIASRCVRFSFNPISERSIEDHLKQIAKTEKIQIEGQAIRLIAKNSEGSFRDAISFLDQFRNSGAAVTEEYVAKVLGISPLELIKELINEVADFQVKKTIEILEKLRLSGSSDSQIIKQVNDYLRDYLTGYVECNLDKARAVSLTERLLRVEGYSNQRAALEIVLIEASLNYDDATVRNNVQADVVIRQKTNRTDSEKKLEKLREETDTQASSDKNIWQSVLENLKSSNSTLYSIARMAEIRHADNKVILHFEFPFHFKQISMERNSMIIEKLIKSLDGNIQQVEIVLKEREGTVQNQPENRQKTDESVASISNIFGSAEVLES
ncbi:MAG TPA: DNA polymerase III subunit gamma/tau [Patescibacteria group bacterium]|nr:DNA polymerase III subunit gamma/tau [Patescibacteria group bacterium]